MPLDYVPALTVQPPWSTLIAEGVKPVENRSWPTTHRAQLLIHAGKTLDWDALWGPHVRDALAGRGLKTLPSGAIVALVTLTGCHEAAYCCPPWGMSIGWHWTMANVQALADPVPAIGQLGLWRPSDGVAAAVFAQLPAGVS